MLPKDLEEICEFRDCPNIETIESYIKEPFPIKAFDDVVKMFATLYVPTGTKAKYEATEGWKDFANIVESEALGITKVSPDCHAKQIYDLSGRKTNEQKHGLNILRMNDGKVKKILVK